MFVYICTQHQAETIVKFICRCASIAFFKVLEMHGACLQPCHQTWLWLTYVVIDFSRTYCISHVTQSVLVGYIGCTPDPIKDAGKGNMQTVHACMHLFAIYSRSTSQYGIHTYTVFTCTVSRLCMQVFTAY